MIDWFLNKVSRLGVKLGLWADKQKSKRVVKKETKKTVGIIPLAHPDIKKPELPTFNEKVIRIAQMEIGVKEVLGPANSDRVMKYHQYASRDNESNKLPDSVPWCSSFVCYLIEKAGLRSTNSMLARSWQDWGFSSIEDPYPGDIVVFWRKKKTGTYGHVGVFLRKNPDGAIVCLGGNQADEVNISTFNPSKVLDIRRASESLNYDRGDLAKLNFLAHSMINGKLLEVAGRVV